MECCKTTVFESKYLKLANLQNARSITSVELKFEKIVASPQSVMVMWLSFPTLPNSFPHIKGEASRKCKLSVNSALISCQFPLSKVFACGKPAGRISSRKAGREDCKLLRVSLLHLQNLSNPLVQHQPWCTLSNLYHIPTGRLHRVQQGYTEVNKDVRQMWGRYKIVL